MAAFSLVRTGDSPSLPLAADVVATVGGREISLAKYQALLSDMVADSSAPLDAEDRQFALDRLIDEELLVMQGVQLGMDHSDPAVRKAIASTLISSVSSRAESMEADDATLQQFYKEYRAFFASEPRYFIQWYAGALAADPETQLDALARATQAGSGPAAVEALGLTRRELLPAQPLTASKVRDYLGPRLTEAAIGLNAGDWSVPIVLDRRVHLLFLADKVPGSEPQFEDVRHVVEIEYRRRQGELALRRYLDALREERQVRINQQLLDQS